MNYEEDSHQEIRHSQMHIIETQKLRNLSFELHTVAGMMMRIYI